MVLPCPMRISLLDEKGANKPTSPFRLRLYWCYSLKRPAKAETVASAVLKSGVSP